ncbi:ACT domain-containing protein [bacterium]|nr:ACT domain-containing protein [bacterium]
MSFPSTSNPIVTFRIGVQDRPGVMAAVANVFSGRGVSMESILTLRGWSETDEPQVIVTVRANERRRRLLHRVLERLEVVNNVMQMQAEDAAHFEMAWVRVRTGTVVCNGVRSMAVEKTSEDHDQFLLLGDRGEVEKELQRLDKEGVLLGANISRISQ